MIAEFRARPLDSVEVMKSHQPNGLSLPSKRRTTPIVLSSSQTHCGLAGARNVTVPIAHLQPDNHLSGEQFPPSAASASALSIESGLFLNKLTGKYSGTKASELAFLWRLGPQEI